MAIMALMKTVSISELKNRLSAYLDMVRAGESVMVLDRDLPVAVIQKVGEVPEADPRLLRLERAGLVRRPAGGPGPGLALLNEPPPKSSASVLQALVEDRREGR